METVYTAGSSLKRTVSLFSVLCFGYLCFSASESTCKNFSDMQAFFKYTFFEINLSILKRMALFTIPKFILGWCLNNNFQVSVELEKDRSRLPDSGRGRERNCHV